MAIDIQNIQRRYKGSLLAQVDELNAIEFRSVDKYFLENKKGYLVAIIVEGDAWRGGAKRW